jgi:hypothetical protein
MRVRKRAIYILVVNPEVKLVIHSIDRGIPRDDLGSSLGVIPFTVTTRYHQNMALRGLAEYLGQLLYICAGSALTSYL